MTPVVTEADVLNDSTIPQTPQEPAEQTAARRRRADAGLAQLFLPSLLVIIAFAAGWFGNAFVNRANYVSPLAAQGQTNDEYLVVQAWNDITNHFVVTSAIDQQTMAYAAINAMIGTLNDPGHSRFETAAQYKQEQGDLNNTPTVGIGVYLAGGGAQPLVIQAVVPNSPASKSTLEPGDEIIAVDGTRVSGMTASQVRALVVGAKNSTVELTITRPSVNPTATFTVAIKRAPFTAPDVAAYIIPGTGIDDLQITEFGADTSTQLTQALKYAQAQHVTGIILDLRGNPGGYLDQAITVASQFIPAGPGKNVLIEKTRTGRHSDPVQPGGLATTIPLVILVDGNTASAAEITAGSIAVNRPSVHVVGERTFGTGTVLQTFQLADGSVLVLGTEEFLLPNGQSIYHIGITPQQVVALPANTVPLAALVAQEDHLNGSQIARTGDTQMQTAINDLTGPAAAASNSTGAAVSATATPGK